MTQSITQLLAEVARLKAENTDLKQKVAILEVEETDKLVACYQEGEERQNELLELLLEGTPLEIKTWAWDEQGGAESSLVVAFEKAGVLPVDDRSRRSC